MPHSRPGRLDSGGVGTVIPRSSHIRHLAEGPDHHAGVCPGRFERIPLALSWPLIRGGVLVAIIPEGLDRH